MNQEEDDIIRAERYLQGEMRDPEKEAVKLRISEDPDFKRLVDDIKILRQSVRVDARDGMRLKLREIEERNTSGDTHGSRGWYWSLGIAASVFLVVAIYLWWPVADHDNNLALFGEVFEPYPNIIMPVERGPLDSTSMAKAFQAYELGDYDTVIHRLEVESNKDAGVFFYLAISYLAKGETQQARLNLEKASEQGSHSFSEQIQWYRALSYLKDMDKDNTMRTLESIVKGGGSYTTRANNLMAKLKSAK